MRNSYQLKLLIDRYPKRYRARARKLAKQSLRFEDLMYSFPAAIIALVTKRGTTLERKKARELVIAGAPRGQIASLLQIPAWMTRFPPEAFSGPLPASLSIGEEETQFGRRLANCVPSEICHMASWLNRVLRARQICDDEFALWIAAKSIPRSMPLKHLDSLAAYAWFSRHAQHEAADLIDLPWSPDLSFRRATYETYCWMMEILLDICIDHQAGSMIMSQARHVEGLDFVPLLTTGALKQEGRIMDNCMPSYGGLVLAGTCRLYSLRRNDLHVANLEVRLDRISSQIWRITSILGPGNENTTLDVIDKAYTWLALQNDECRNEGRSPVLLPIDPDYWQLLWDPWWQARPPEGGQAVIIPSPKITDLHIHMKILVRTIHLSKGQ